MGYVSKDMKFVILWKQYNIHEVCTLFQLKYIFNTKIIVHLFVAFCY